MTSNIVNYINNKIKDTDISYNDISYNKIVFEKFNIYSAIVCKYNYIYKTDYKIKINKDADINNILSIIENYIIDNINIPELNCKPNETYTNIERIENVNVENIYIKPIYSIFDLYINKDENSISFYQLYKNPLRNNKLRNKLINYTVVNDGYLKLSADVLDDYISINLFIDISINVPKIGCKFIGTSIITKLLNDIETLIT